MVHETILAGRVVDAATQLPVAGARVRPEGGEGVAWSANQESTLTDGDGRFRIDGLPQGRYRPSAEAIGAKGRVSESFVLGAGESASDLVIALSPAHHVQGRVTLDGKTVCKDGYVSLSEKTSGEGDDWRRIDAEGSVLFPALDDGTYEVSLECDGIETYPKAPLVVDRNLDGVTWSVPRGLAIRGVVVDGDGRPLAEVTVRASGSDPSADTATNGYAVSASDGSFTIAGLGATTYQLSADSVDHASAPSPMSLSITAGRDTDGVRLVMPRGGIIEGVVVDTAGYPVASARVQSGGGASRFATTDGEGRFRLTGLTAGNVWINVTSELGRQLPSSVPAKDLEVVDGKTLATRLVVKRAEGILRGRVVDGQGKPVAGAFVDADHSEFAQRLTSLSSETSVVTDTNGMFVIRGLEEGPHSVRARTGAKEATLVGVALGSDVTLKLESGAIVEGTAVFVDGHAPARFTVALTSGYASLREEFVGTSGRFTFRSVPPGAATFVVTTPQGQGQGVAKLEANGTVSVTITLSAFRVVTGRVVDENGRPVPHADVAAEASDRYATSDDRGEFVLENVFGEKLELEVYTNGEVSMHVHLSNTMDASSNAAISLGDVVLKPATDVLPHDSQNVVDPE